MITRRVVTTFLASAALMFAARTVFAQPAGNPSTIGRAIPDGVVRFIFALFLGMGAMWAITTFGQWLGARRGRYPAFKKPSVVVGVIGGVVVFLFVMGLR